MTYIKGLVFAAFCFASAMVRCQILVIGDVVNMREYNFSRVDSVMKLKGFEKTDDDNEPGFHIAKYSYVQKADTAINRYDFVMGEQINEKRKTLRYVVWSKAAEEGVVKWLLGNGYKKKVTKFPSLGNESPDNFVQYIKGGVAITYLEEKNDDDKSDIKIRWAFELNIFNGR